MKHLNRMLAVAIAAAAVSAPAFAAGSPDAKWMATVAQGGMTEVEAGKLASKMGGKDAQKFGDQMVRDHSKANGELKALATKEGVTLPTTVGMVHQNHLDALAKKKGKDFDKAYFDQMHKDHVATIALFETESKSGKDPAAKAWATKTLPTLRSHLAMCDQMMKGMSGKGTMGTMKK